MSKIDTILEFLVYAKTNPDKWSEESILNYLKNILGFRDMSISAWDARVARIHTSGNGWRPKYRKFEDWWQEQIKELKGE